MSDFIKASKVVATAIGLLLRETTLPQLVFRDAALDPKLVLNDTVSIRLPAYAPANTRALRSGDARQRDNLHERKVDVTLDTDVYKDVKITDEELTLDIANFGGQILNPILGGVVQKLEDILAGKITGAAYDNTIAYTGATDDPYASVAVPARARLNQAYVPAAGRVLLVGSEVESDFLLSDKFVRADMSGSTGTLREAMIGRVAGFDVISSPAIPAAEAYAFHRTAYALVSRAPVMPAGAPWGDVMAAQGFAIRAVRILDSATIEDVLAVDSWVGANIVPDTGHYDADPAAGGKFVPVTDPANPIAGQVNAWENDTARLIRSVKITRA